MNGARARPVAQLLWADYRARHARRHEGAARAALLAVPRLVVDPGLHAVALLRIVGSAPPPLRGLAQRCLLWGHGIYADPAAEIGAGVCIPHPIAITLGAGVSVGDGALIYHNVTLRAAGPPPCDGPKIGTGVRIYTGAVVCGDVEIGRGAMIGAGAVVSADVMPRARVARGHGAAAGGDAIVGRRSAPASASAPAPLGPAGLRALLAADHRARFGAGARPSGARLLRDALRDRGSRVTTIVRLMQAGPRPLARLWRRALLVHGCDIGFDAAIGGGLSIPCPIGVCIGRRAILGERVELLEHTCATPTTTSWYETAAAPRFALGDGVSLQPGAGAFGEVQVAAGAIIGPRALVTRDVGAACVAAAAIAATQALDDQLAERECPPGVAEAPPPAAADRRLGLRALLRSDLDRLTAASSTTPLRARLSLPFQAAALTRLATCARPRAAGFGRRALRSLHHCYVDEDVRIGPGLLLPLPCGIRIERGARIGANVTIQDRVSLRADRSPPAAPTIADGSVLGSASVIAGQIKVRGAVGDGEVRLAFTKRHPICHGLAT